MRTGRLFCGLKTGCHAQGEIGKRRVVGWNDGVGPTKKSGLVRRNLAGRWRSIETGCNTGSGANSWRGSVEMVYITEDWKVASSRIPGGTCGGGARQALRIGRFVQLNYECCENFGYNLYAARSPVQSPTCLAYPRLPLSPDPVLSQSVAR